MRSLVAAFLLAFGSALLAETAAPVKPKPVLPIEAELLRSLNSESMHTGDEVVAKLKVDWSDGTCNLPSASLLHGIVMDVTSAGTKRTHVALQFRYRCKGTDPKKLIWLALLAPEPNGSLVIKQALTSSSFGGGNGMRSAGNEPVGGSGPPGNRGGGAPSNLDLSGRQNPSFPLFVESEEERKADRPQSIKTGEVWKIPHLKLDVGTGPDDSTVLSSNEKHVKLPMGSILVLLPESAAVVATVVNNAPAAKPAATPKRAAYKLPPEIAPCTEPACTVVASIVATSNSDLQAVKTIPVAHLGYHRLKTAAMHDLEFGTATAFLGNDHLLFTFDPHTLLRREPGDRPEDHPHMVRAVLLNIATGKAEHTSEWRVRSDAQYLWTVDGEHVVIHDGDRLRWLNKGMHEQQELRLEGALAFLRMSPDRRHYAIGVVHELHTPDEHADLLKADAAGPKEQVQVKLLNAHLKIEDEGQASSRAMPPVLLDTGRIELRRARDNSFYLREIAWPSTNQPGGSQPHSVEPRDFARMQSSCIPRLQSMSSNLLVAEGCDKTGNDHWLRVFRQDGTPVLKSLVRWREFSPLIADNGEGGLFAMATCEGGGDYVRSSTFHGADLSRETVRIHRAADGHEIFTASIRSPLPANQPVSFSPGGERVAVIDGDEILLYDTGLPAANVAQR